MAEKTDLSSIRREYSSGRLDESTINEDPFEQFKAWFDEVLLSDIKDPNAFFLATADANSKPSVRTVLLKDFDTNGFVFFTNYQSKKGKDLEENPFASLLFYWDFNNRQVRIEGKVEKVSAAVSDNYFYSRPVESQIGAIASNQSEVISDRRSLEQKVNQISKQDKIVRPKNWGGYILKPNYFEYWQGQLNRLHDRIAYRFVQNNKWVIERLSP